MNELFFKVFLISYFVLYYGILLVLNSFLVFRRTGTNPYVMGQAGGVIGYVEKSIKMAGIVIPIVLLVYLFSQSVYLALIPIHCLEVVLCKYVGVGIMTLGFIVCLTAQYSMRCSWRIGIALNSEVTLVTDGIFRYCRNPFFLGSLLSYAGFFLVLPNVVSLTVGVVYFVLIQIQVRFEEENLDKSLGQTYQDYRNRVRRWF